MLCALAIACRDSDVTEDESSSVLSEVPEGRWFVTWRNSVAAESGGGDAALAVGAVLVGENTIVTGSYTTGSLVAIDADSRSVRHLGRRGDGPGEFRALHRVRRCSADEVVAQDFENGRVTFVSPKLEVRAIQAVPPRVLGGELIACARDRTLLFVNDPPEVPGDGVYTVNQVAYSVRSSDGNVARLGAWSITQMVFDTRLQVFFPLPLGQRALSAGSDDNLYVVHATSCRVTRLRTGESPLKRRVVRHVLARPIDQARARARIVDEMTDSVVRRKVRLAMERTRSGGTPPCAEQAVGGTGGQIWIRLASSDVDTTATWLQLDRELRPILRLTLPGTMDVMDARGEQVLVLEKSVDDGQLQLLRSCLPGTATCPR